MTRPLTRIVATIAVAATAALVTACAPATAESEPEPTKTVAIEPSTPAPQPEASASSDPDVEEPTCDTIISPTTVKDFESLGWTSLADKFLVGSIEIPDGVQCIWGDFSTATDHVQLFGWAPISADQAESAQTELVAQGWRREDSPEGVYVTESAETASSVDEEGYGLTYLFGDGWVKYADTKQGILLVEWPQT
ncbi:hypothetical protein G5T42_13530 [Microbacterium sp. 4R-513]|uniref:hypothetical protein n=1 Tax=Microbacterium sp. 4R-513 TaxID=2567934 RepID=UPI0013E1BFDB|nr:hypothetical protein [Microbacterium sp. 4R-513]QIG40369.1 hypothetical protein G5T42_13530 [Microbacterium sp. 4R-513]